MAVNFFKVEQLAEQSTTSGAFVDVPGTTLTFTPTSASDIWMIFLSGVCRSSSTSEQSMELTLNINGTEEDLWSHQNSSTATPNGSGFLVFDRITGTTSLQTVKMQYRALTGTVFVDDIRVVAIKVPANADFQFFESNAIVTTAGSDLVIGTLTFTPASVGDYIVIGSVKHREFPGGSTSQAWFEDIAAVPGPDLRPNAPAGVHHSNARDSWNPATYAWFTTLGVFPQNFNIRFTSSGSGGAASQHRYRKLMAFRTDAWDDVDTSLVEAESSTTIGTFQTKNTLTTGVPPEARDYFSIQTARIGGPTSSSRKAGELRIGGTAQVRSNHRINRDNSATEGYHHTIGLVDARNQAGAVTYANGFLSPDGITVNCAESAIIVLRYPSNMVKKCNTHQLIM